MPDFQAHDTPSDHRAEQSSEKGEVVQLQYQNVLCLAGFLDQRDPAFEFASGVAHCFGGSVHVLLILDAPFRSRRGEAVRKPEKHQPLTPEIIEDASRRLSMQYRGEPHTDCFVLPGDPRIELGRYVRNHKIQLVAMCQETFLEIQKHYGNVAAEMPCPVIALATMGTDNLGLTRPQEE